MERLFVVVLRSLANKKIFTKCNTWYQSQLTEELELAIKKFANCSQIIKIIRACEIRVQSISNRKNFGLG